MSLWGQSSWFIVQIPPPNFCAKVNCSVCTKSHIFKNTLGMKPQWKSEWTFSKYCHVVFRFFGWNRIFFFHMFSIGEEIKKNKRGKKQPSWGMGGVSIQIEAKCSFWLQSKIKKQHKSCRNTGLKNWKDWGVVEEQRMRQYERHDWQFCALGRRSQWLSHHYLYYWIGRGGSCYLCLLPHLLSPSNPHKISSWGWCPPPPPPNLSYTSDNASQR